MKMEPYKPQYPIIRTEDLVPRDQIKLVPEKELKKTDPALLTELHNIRRCIEYEVAVLDIPQNRRVINLKTGYFQMVAYKEGWKFNPELYKVVFVSPEEADAKKFDTIEARIYSFNEVPGKEVLKRFMPPVSPKYAVGFEIKGNTAHRMKPSKTDKLSKKVSKLFK